MHDFIRGINLKLSRIVSFSVAMFSLRVYFMGMNIFLDLWNIAPFKRYMFYLNDTGVAISGSTISFEYFNEIKVVLIFGFVILGVNLKIFYDSGKYERTVSLNFYF